MRSSSFIQSVCASLMFLAAMPGLAQEPPKKTPVPATAALADATKLIKEIYGDEYAKAKTTTEKRALAKKLLEKANETKDDPASQYVLLRLARDIATQANDGQTAFPVIDAMAEAFQVDAVEMKSVVLHKLATAAQTPADHKTIVKAVLNLLDQAISHDNFMVADELGKLALAEARNAPDKEFVTQAQGRIDEVTELANIYENVKAAKVTLGKTPADPAANLTVGRFDCFIKGDWNKGLPMLMLGSDAQLKALAKQELEGVVSSKEQAKLGDDWWTLAEAQDGKAKVQIQSRAGYWYQKALPGATGLVKDKVEKRLREVTAGKASTLPSEEPVAKKDSRLTQMVTGRFQVTSIQKRANKEKKQFWDFRPDGSLWENDNRTGTWTSDDNAVRIRFTDVSLGQATIRPKGKEIFIGAQTYGNGEIWSCTLIRLSIVATGQHRVTGAKKHGSLTLWSNGHIGTPDGPGTWERGGAKVLLHWHNGNTDVCTLSPDGHFRGHNQTKQNVHVEGSLNWKQ